MLKWKGVKKVKWNGVFRRMLVKGKGAGSLKEIGVRKRNSFRKGVIDVEGRRFNWKVN